MPSAASVRGGLWKPVVPASTAVGWRDEAQMLPRATATWKLLLNP